MEKTTFLLFILLISGFAESAPNDNSFVVSSTESSSDNEKEGAPSNVPLDPVIDSMDIKANISNRFAKTLVVSKVKNIDTSAKQTTFTVVLPEKAFISEFVMEIGGKSYKAFVKEKEEAKNIYNEAVATGRSAGYVAVSARDSNRFTVSINIEPEAKAVFLLTYEELLQRRNDQYELVLNIHPGQIIKQLNVEVQVTESRPLKFVKTPSLRSGNEISKNEDKLDPSSDIQIINSTTAIVKFKPDSEKQKQFARALGTKESDGLSGQFLVQYDVERDPQGGEVLLQDGYFVHFFAPSDLEPLPKHVVFVLDTSGSMGGQKIAQLKDAMNSILNEIKNDDVLHVLEFNNNVLVWDINEETAVRINHKYGDSYEEPFGKLNNINLPQPISANEINIGKAKNVIQKLDANGGTFMIGGLEAALHLVKVEQEKNVTDTEKHQPIIIFLTDGDPNVGLYSTEEIVKIVTRLNSENNKVPIFSLSFGYGANKEFLRKLSLKNLGFSRHIYEASDASLQLQEFYKEISSPLLSNINFKYQSEVEAVTKAQFPIFFKGSELVIAGRYKDPSFPSIIDCWGSRGKLILRPSIERPVTSLERLWAYLTVKQTLDQRNTVENKTELTKKALDLALKYSFVTDVSSLVVVKPNDTSAVNTEEADEVSGPTYTGLQFHSISALGSSRRGGGLTSFGRIHSRPAPGSGGYYSARPAAGPVRYDSVPVIALEGSQGPSLGLKGSQGPPRDLLPAPPPASLPQEQKLENILPWLKAVLNSNGTLTVSQGVYDLGEDSSTTKNKECPSIPSNSTETGICTLLKDCPEVYSSLTDFHVYEQYFCPIENKFAGVCCPKKTTIEN